jgi:hypothetical protein
MRAKLILVAASLLIACASTWAHDREHPIDDDPPVLDLIRTADEVYVFPVTNPHKGRRHDQRLRLLDAKAKQEIAHLLSDRQNWWHGGWGLLTSTQPRRDIGLVFRHQENELVLFFDGTLVEGTFNGQDTNGLFDDRRAKKLEQWKRRYARPELSANQA